VLISKLTWLTVCCSSELIDSCWHDGFASKGWKVVYWIAFIIFRICTIRSIQSEYYD
jgi:hypothetical protein